MNFSYVVTAMSSISLCFVLLLPLGFPAAAILIGIYHHSGGAGVEGLLGLTLFAGLWCGDGRDGALGREFVGCPWIGLRGCARVVSRVDDGGGIRLVPGPVGSSSVLGWF